MADHGPRIHLTISSHGYGHLTQAIALARELKNNNSDINFRIQCNLPKKIIADRLGTDDFEHDECSMDIGLIQTDPITPDLNATYKGYDALHENYCERVACESKNLKNWHPDLVISDIPYLPLAAAGDAGIPGVALASLTWDCIIKAYFNLTQKAPAKWYADAQASYRESTLALLPMPAMNGDCFLNKKHIPPIISLGKKQNTLRSLLNIKDDDCRPIILCSLGGIPGAKLPISIMINENNFHWLINASDFPNSENIHNLSSCSHWHYKDVIASVDGVIGKPGYGMAVEAVAHGLPFVFFRRGHFPDEPFIIDWLHKNTRVKEISSKAWSEGAFVDPLKKLMNLPPQDAPVCNGAELGALAIEELLC
ncbi:MAG: hypothetical protein OQL19_06870 [Gammaproteobacteria bacterium]|nr:hypothetical protein [Gammaproteobacteria bacterium]